MKKWIAGTTLLLTLAFGALYWSTISEDDIVNDNAAIPIPTQSAATRAATLEKGAYLARAGNCIGCHTTRGGAAYAGGLGISTPFGTIYSSNLTPDAQTGIGNWSPAHFWRAMHHGRSRDGRLLYPAFPYPNYTQLTREDSDALFAFLRSQPAVSQLNQAHDLRFPYGLQVSLAAWRILYFTPGGQAAASRDAQWQRGAYLVRGIGHCGACHTPRSGLAGTDDGRELQGAMMLGQPWHAPSLAGLQHVDVAQLLKAGGDGQRWVGGPMAQVVHDSTQYLDEADLQAIALFLKSLPPAPPPAPVAALSTTGKAMSELGAKIYEQHCASCHGADGKGVENAYPPLAGNRAVLQATPANLVQVTLNGGFAATTTANPRPFGMPPYAPVLNNAEIAAVLTYIRNAWGNQADAVSELQIRRSP